jgi:hypothetical protein
LFEFRFAWEFLSFYFFPIYFPRPLNASKFFVRARACTVANIQVHLSTPSQARDASFMVISPASISSRRRTVVTCVCCRIRFLIGHSQFPVGFLFSILIAFLDHTQTLARAHNSWSENRICMTKEYVLVN